MPGLDCIRGVAALIVLGFHVELTQQNAGFLETGIFGRGYLPVDFFFLLSGYVLARSYEGRMDGFVLIRIKRLYPTMFVAGLIALPLLFLGSVSNGVQSAALYFLMLPSFATLTLFPLNGPAWSIFFEFIANLIHAVLLHRVRTVLVGFMVLVSLGYLAYFGASIDSFDLGSKSTTFFGGFVRVLASYGLGIILWRLWRDHPPVNLHPALTLAMMPAAVLASGLLNSWLFDLIFVVMVGPILLAGGLKLDGGRIGAFAGAISFPLYAFHMPILLLFIFNGWPWFAAAVISILSAASFVYLPRYWREWSHRSMAKDAAR